MNTAFALLARFESPTIPLELICEEFFGLRRDKAYQRAAAEELPVPTFRASDSQKAPRLVHVDDLANFLDAQRATAKKQWEKANT